MRVLRSQYNAAVVVVLLLSAASAVARRPASRPEVFKARVTPTWTDATHFWYRNDLPDGRREIVVVDAAAGTRQVVEKEPAVATRPASDAPSTRPTSMPASMPRPVEDADRGAERGRPVRSRDGRRVAVLRDHNVCIGETEADAKPVTANGTAGFAYDRVFFSPDGRSVVAYRKREGDHLPVYRLESSPRDMPGVARPRVGGGTVRAVLHTDEYTLPGDALDTFQVTLIDVESGHVIIPDVDAIDANEWGSHPDPRPRWRPDGHRFAYEKYDRGQQRVRLIEVDAVTGDTRTLLDEQSKTFIWTAHPSEPSLRLFTYLPNGREAVYLSERSGWRQLYLLDLDTADLRPMTQGQWVLRGIVRVDAETRQVWFTAGGVYPDQDPYYVHYGRVQFDGSGLTWLTDADGTHELNIPAGRQRGSGLNRSLSPDGQFLIVAHSRVDLPPVTELRRTDDGRLVMKLEDAIVTGDWRPLERFVAKGRDGTTDIYGVIRRPAEFDPNKKYPVVENVYAGPQGAFVPKAFRPTWGYDGLADRGFVVVQADGMGTAMRSKAFHDVCWQNLADAGFADRIAWIKAAAKGRPWMDVSRVGIYGTSAGGQTAAGALLFHNDFYKAAVANCGCHDNRMDKISWNEQWMGWPVGPQYAASSNIDHAAKLKGHLQLVLGEMDDNVPVESTYRLVDALVKAKKEFDFVLIPGAGHGASSPITQRKLEDFFVRHLQGVEPANTN